MFGAQRNRGGALDESGIDAIDIDLATEHTSMPATGGTIVESCKPPRHASLDRVVQGAEAEFDSRGYLRLGGPWRRRIGLLCGLIVSAHGQNGQLEDKNDRGRQCRYDRNAAPCGSRNKKTDNRRHTRSLFRHCAKPATAPVMGCDKHETAAHPICPQIGRDPTTCRTQVRCTIWSFPFHSCAVL